MGTIFRELIESVKKEVRSLYDNGTIPSSSLYSFVYSRNKSGDYRGVDIIPVGVIYSGIIGREGKIFEYKVKTKLTPQGIEAFLHENIPANKLKKGKHYRLNEVIVSRERDSYETSRQGISTALGRRHTKRVKKSNKPSK